MTQFIPGKKLKSFTTKSGTSATLRYTQWSDLRDLLDYINQLSTEDTFVRFSGEQQSLEDEARYLASTFIQMEMRKAVYLVCVIDGKLAGYSGVNAQPELKKRGEHVGLFGISVAKDFRGEGIGFEMMTTVIQEATVQMADLKLIHLECFASNINALKLYQKIGFKEVGRIPKFAFHKGIYDDEVQMVLGVQGWQF